MSSSKTRGFPTRKKKVKKAFPEVDYSQCVCRICMSDVDALKNPLLAPCSCKGI